MNELWTEYVNEYAKDIDRNIYNYVDEGMIYLYGYEQSGIKVYVKEDEPFKLHFYSFDKDNNFYSTTETIDLKTLPEELFGKFTINFNDVVNQTIDKDDIDYVVEIIANYPELAVSDNFYENFEKTFTNEDKIAQTLQHMVEYAKDEESDECYGYSESALLHYLGNFDFEPSDLLALKDKDIDAFKKEIIDLYESDHNQNEYVMHKILENSYLDKSENDYVQDLIVEKLKKEQTKTKDLDM